MSDILERLRRYPSGTLTEKSIYEAADEIERLQEAKRRALAIADERSKENVELRAEIKRLRAELRTNQGPLIRSR